MTNRSSGQIITFYSYKGGTGRTMALANLACLLARPDPSRKQSAQRRVLAIDWDFEAPGLHRFLKPYLEPESEKRFLNTPGCLELFQHLSSKRVDYNPKDFVGNRNRAKSELEKLNLEEYLLATQFSDLFLMKAGLFDDDYSRRVSEFDWDDLFHTTVGLFAGVADFLRAQFDFVLVDSRTGITDTSGICTMLLPDKLVVVFTPNQQSLTGIESLVRKAVSYRKGSPDGRPLTVFPLPSRIEMARPQLLEAWRNSGGKNRATTALLSPETLGYQQIFEQLFAQIYGRQEIHLEEYFNEVMLQHIPDYAYGEPVAVVLETTESRISLSRSYEAFRDRLVELEVPWDSLKAARLERKIVQMRESIADKLKEGAIEEAIRLSFVLIEHKPSPSQFDRSVNAILDVARAAYLQNRNEASSLISRATRLAIGNRDLDPAVVGQLLFDAGKLSKEFGDLTIATELLKASKENFCASFGAEHPTILMVMDQLSRIQQEQGDLEEARQLYQKSLEIAEKLSDLSGMARSYHQLGMLRQEQGDLEEARQLYQKSLEIAEKLGDLSGMARSYQQLAMLRQAQGDLEEARQLYQKSANIAELKELYQKGLLSEEIYRATLNRLGLGSTAVFDQKKQTVELQMNIAKLIQVVVTPEPGTGPAGLRQAYLHRIFHQTCRLQISGVDPKVVSEEGCWDLQLSAIYTPLMTQRPSAQRLSALAVLDREQYLTLLGDPGSGKSSFVNFVTLCLAGEGLGLDSANIAVMTAPVPTEEDDEQEGKSAKKTLQPWDHGPLLPVRIVLRDLAAHGLPEAGDAAGGDTLWKFIETELGETLKEFAPHLYKTLQEKGALVLLDGLDEVPDSQNRRLQVKQAIKGFVDNFPKCRVLATSRTYAYQKQEWKLDGFAEAVLSPFSPRQISHFVEKWYDHIALVRNLNPEEAKGRAAVLKTAIERNPRLAELAAHPLLLTLMASLHAWRGGSLPEKREELYADAVDLLLNQWEGSKVVLDAAGVPLVRQESLAEYLKVGRVVIRKSLNRLAFEAHRNQPQLTGTADIFQDKLVGMLIEVSRNPDLKPVLQMEYFFRNRAGLLAAKGEGVFTFPHRIFQEYLAACHLTDYHFPDEAVSLFKADPQRWREALLLAGAKAAHGTSSAVWNLAEALCFKKPPSKSAKKGVDAECLAALLAAQTLLENEGERLEAVSERNAPKLERIRLWLRAILEQGRLPVVDRVQAGEALAVLGDDRDFDKLVDVPAGPFQMGSNNYEAERPPHKVSLQGFKIGRYPVTNAQYRRFAEATGLRWNSEIGLKDERSNCPAAEMGWHDARAFCDWLTIEWRKQGKIVANEIVRLPTEAEWEKAARGTDGRVYPWGNDWDKDRCNTFESGIAKTSAVGMYPTGVSPYGCLDMAGNVSEWTSSLYRGYSYRAEDGREEVGAAGLRVLRGGSWDVSQHLARCSHRGSQPPSNSGGDFGFRVVVSPVSHLSAL